jgi:hypothetical protein
MLSFTMSGFLPCRPYHSKPNHIGKFLCVMMRLRIGPNLMLLNKSIEVFALS